jgi:hypothetical protein
MMIKTAWLKGDFMADMVHSHMDSHINDKKLLIVIVVQ